MHTDFYVDDFYDKRNEVLFGEWNIENAEWT